MSRLYPHCALLVLAAIGRIHLVNDLLQVLRHPLQLRVNVLSHLEARGERERGMYMWWWGGGGRESTCATVLTIVAN